MYIFKYQSEDNINGIKSVTMELEDHLVIDEMLDAFKDFLQGCGYVIDGNITVEQEEDIIDDGEDFIINDEQLQDDD